MRIVQCAGFYFPDSKGGTEVYLESLTRNLQALGVESMVAAPAPSERVVQYLHRGASVFRYPVPKRWLRSEVRGDEPPRHFDVFSHWLREQQADIFHQHSWTTGCGLWHLKAAKQLGLKTVVTVHVPANLCMRGTMLREGRVACDGEILSERCASCWLQSRGVPARVARCIGKLPQDFFGLLEPVPRVGPLLAAKKLAENRSKQVREMSAAADRIVAVCDWLQKALLANGVPARKLSLNRQGTGQSGQFIHPTVPKHGPTFRFGFLGRWDPVKGVHVLVDAFKRLGKSLQVELHICAVAGGSDSKRYRENVQFSAADERRIHFLPEINPEQVFEFLTEIDVLVVPSQWLETGPLVVLEAFAAGTPVIGSDLGGIKELVTHGRNGLLISRDDVTAWTEAMARIAVDRELFCQLRSGIGSVRTMSHVADDMVNLYSELLTESSYVA